MSAELPANLPARHLFVGTWMPSFSCLFPTNVRAAKRPVGVACRSLIAFALFALLFCGRTAQATTNPILAQHDISYFPPTGSTGVSTGIWKITLNNATIATDAAPNGWSVRVLNEWPGKVFSVIAPQPPLQDAAIAANYQVFYNYTPTTGGGGAGGTATPGGSDTVGGPGGPGGGGTPPPPTPYSASFDVIAANTGSGTLHLTDAGLAEGFQLRTFAYDFPLRDNGGPHGAVVYGTSVINCDDGDYVRTLSSSADMQNVPAITGHQEGYKNAAGIAMLNGHFYMSMQGDGVVVEITTDGTLIQNIATIPGATGIVADPFRNVIYADDPFRGNIYEIEPITKASHIILSNVLADGLSLSEDGHTLYTASHDDDVIGLDTVTHRIVFDYNRLNPSQPIAQPDGIGVGRGTLAGNLYVNTNYGQFYEINIATGQLTLIATDGSFGDLVNPHTDNSLLVTQTYVLARLVPPPGGSFTGVPARALATRDDLTNPNTTNYAAFTLASPQTSGNPVQNAGFDAFGLSGAVLAATMQRGGQLSWSSGSQFDLLLGLKSSAIGSPTSFAPAIPAYTTNATSPAAYFTFWDLSSALCLDIQIALGANYAPSLVDQLANASSSYSVTDTPTFGWPGLYAKNVLSFQVGEFGAPAVDRGRSLDILLNWLDNPTNGNWEIVWNQTVIASSVQPNGWSVEGDHANAHGVWVDVPASATVGVDYEVRCSHGQGAGFFDVTAAGTVNTAPVMKPLTVANSKVIGGNSTTGTVSLDAAAPTGGATITLVCQTGGVTIPASVTIPVGQQSATFTIATQATTDAYAPIIFASYNGVRLLTAPNTLVILPPGGGSLPTAPLALTATGSTGRVTLNWTQPTSGTALYTVYKGTTTGGPYNPIASGVNATQYLDKNVVNGTTYYYVVTATNLVGESARSNEASATPNGTVPVYQIAVAPASVVGGNYAIGTVTLSTAAPSGGVAVWVTSNNGAAEVPMSSVVVGEGYTSADFLITTTPVVGNTPCTLTANSGGNTVTTTLTVLTPSPTTLTLTPNPVIGGSSSTATLTLNGLAPSGGSTFALTSDNTSIASPAQNSVTVAAGSASATFTVNSSVVTSATPAAITATHSAGCDGSTSANLQVNPANIACYISDLTLSPTCIIGTGTSTATITLSAPAPTGGAIVKLKSSNPNVTVPASVSVAAGQQTATFTVNDTGVDLPDVGDATEITVSGAYNTWTQAAILMGLPTGYTLNVQGLSAAGGNGCVVLTWSDLPDGTVNGYNIYKMVGNTPVLLNAIPVRSATFADTGLTNGSVYSYKVSVVTQGQEGSTSAQVSATPLASCPTLTVSNVPTVPVSGRIDLYALSSTGLPIVGDLLVDGKIVSCITPSERLSTNPDQVFVSVDTSFLSNGIHTFQLIGHDASNVYTSSSMSVQITNGFSSLYADNITLAYDGELTRIKTTLPASTSQWTLQVVDNNNNVIRSWQATSPNAQLAWDGADQAGNFVEDGAYNLQILAYKQNGQHQDLQKPVHKHSRHLYALGLIGRIVKQSDSDNLGGWPEQLEKQQLQAITGIWKTIHKSGSFSFDYTILGPDDTSGDGTTEAAKVNKLLHTVQVFYLVAHGTPNDTPGAMSETNWNGVRFDPGEPLAGSSAGDNSALVNTTIFVTRMTKLKKQGFHFVFLDCCQSAGGVGTNVTKDFNYEIGTPDSKWSKAFGINPNDSHGNGFFGWNGDGFGAWYHGGVYSTFYYWRIAFWGQMGLNNYYSVCSQNATNYALKQNLKNYMYPWEGSGNNKDQAPWRCTFFGDWLLGRLDE